MTIALRRRLAGLAIAGLLLGLTGLWVRIPGAGAAGPVVLNGAGATFPYPLYSRWFAEYNRLHPDVRINYQSIGSGGGIAQVKRGTVDFGASDAPLSDDQLKAMGQPVLLIPTGAGATRLGGAPPWNGRPASAARVTRASRASSSRPRAASGTSSWPTWCRITSPTPSCGTAMGSGWPPRSRRRRPRRRAGRSGSPR